MRAWWRVRVVVVGVVGAVGVAGLAGCAGSASPGGTSDRPVAEVADGADCAVREVLAAFGSGGGEDLPAAPRAGAVPDGFDPVAAVECRMAEVVLLPAPEVAPPVLPDEAQPGEAQPGDPMQVPATPPPGFPVDVVRLEGDLGPLLDELARPDVPAEPDQACMAMFEVVPLLYLVDADDRAVRVQWPKDGCNFLLDGARASVDALDEGERTTIRLPAS